MSGVAVDRKLRDRAIVEARGRGESSAAIAERFRCSERTVRRVIERARRAPVDLDELDPDLALREAIETHRDVLAELTKIGRRGDSSSARVGALRSRALTSRSLIELLAWAGLVPERTRVWRTVRDAREVARAFGEAADELGVDRGQLVEALERRLPEYMVRASREKAAA